MPKISIKISKSYRYVLYTTLSASVVTGTGFWLLRNFGMVEGDFGPESHVLQYPFLQAHGFSAFVMLMSLGAIFSSHIPKTWSAKRAKKSGIGAVSLFIFSILSAYSLYYLASDKWHEILGNVHALVGLSLPAVLIFHIYIARQSTHKKKAKKDRKHR